MLETFRFSFFEDDARQQSEMEPQQVSFNTCGPITFSDTVLLPVYCTMWSVFCSLSEDVVRKLFSYFITSLASFLFLTLKLKC